jgi:selenocysteine lyase/cysteine desulfurase
MEGADMTDMAERIANHPIQPLQMESGVLRFKRNKIVEHLLDSGGIDMNELARMDFPAEDWTQFRQLIGYSHSGIPNCPEEVWQAALAMYEQGVSEAEARANHLRDELAAIRADMRSAVARLYGIHPDDLRAQP